MQQKGSCFSFLFIADVRSDVHCREAFGAHCTLFRGDPDFIGFLLELWPCSWTFHRDLLNGVLIRMLSSPLAELTPFVCMSSTLTSLVSPDDPVSPLAAGTLSCLCCRFIR